MTATFNYNTDVTLWQNMREHLSEMPYGGARILISDGHVNDGLQILARFTDDRDATKTLLAAGFRQFETSNGQRYFKA